MKKIFTPELWGQIFIQLIISGVIIFFLHGYYQNKWTPLTAAETLKKENYLNAKKETYSDALNIVTRHLSTYKFKGYEDPVNFKRNIGSLPVTEFEINSCQSRLYIYSDNIEIISSFKNIFKKGLNPFEQQINLINNIKKDMSNSKNLNAESYEYITLSSDTTLK